MKLITFRTPHETGARKKLLGDIDTENGGEADQRSNYRDCL